MAVAASQAGDADSSRAPGLTSGLQGSVNVLRGIILLVPQWQYISSFVFYIVINALAWDRNVAWCTVRLLFLKSFTKSETDRALIKTYSVQEHSEFKHVVPCFSGNATVRNGQSDKLPWRIIIREVKDHGTALMEM